MEIQKDEPTEYHILDRVVFYVSRQISSKKEREFVKSQYNDIKQVYSIWICLNQKINALKHICFEEKDLYRLFGTLFSDKLDAEEKIRILETEYHIPMEEKLRGGLDTMCNLSQGIKEEGIRLGEKRGENKMIQLFSRLISNDRLEECYRITQDESYRRQLLKELNIR